MTSNPPRAGLPVQALAAALLTLGLATAPARAAEPTYPFEGTWVRANRVCVANAPRVRSYTAHDVSFATGHCSFRKVAGGGGQFEVFEECRRSEHNGNYTEKLRMLSPDLMVLRRQASRLKIARPLRYIRCTIAAPQPSAAPKAASPPSPHHGAEPKGAEPQPSDPKAADPQAAHPKR